MVDTGVFKNDNNELDDTIEDFDKVLKRKKEEDEVDLFATKMFNTKGKKKDDPFDPDNFGDFNI